MTLGDVFNPEVESDGAKSGGLRLHRAEEAQKLIERV